METKKLKKITRKEFIDELIKDSSDESSLAECAMANSEFIYPNDDSDDSELSLIELVGEFIPYLLMGGDENGNDGSLTYEDSYKAIDKLIHTYNKLTGYYDIRSYPIDMDIEN